MPFECPACDDPKLEISFSLELPPQGDDDEITLQTLKCAGCGFNGVAVYRESRHGSLDSESWNHNGYPIDDSYLERLYEALLLCPKPSNKHCPCPTHVAFAQQNWVAPAHLRIDMERRFEMRLAR
jgi:hypothetical protein